jgi:hypothetical protein
MGELWTKGEYGQDCLALKICILLFKMIFFKKIQDFIVAQPLDEMILFFDM